MGRRVEEEGREGRGGKSGEGIGEVGRGEERRDRRGWGWKRRGGEGRGEKG